MMVVYYSCVGVVPKVRLRQRNAGFYTIGIHVDVIFAFAWTRRYAASRSVFPIIMNFEGHLMRMAVIMWSILNRQKLYKHG